MADCGTHYIFFDGRAMLPFVSTPHRETAIRPPLYSAFRASSTVTYKAWKLLQGGAKHVLNLFDAEMQNP
jgi:hypothetical protein